MQHEGEMESVWNAKYKMSKMFKCNSRIMIELVKMRLNLDQETTAKVTLKQWVDNTNDRQKNLHNNS